MYISSKNKADRMGLHYTSARNTQYIRKEYPNIKILVLAIFILQIFATSALTGMDRSY